ncbi:hypothetical protein PLESTB_000080900 [Pleodorina starrii]|uniref:Limiting CO2-inducible protein B/C beta carbonyic anhydrase domain-containing protein n=1 Tax=Pleodorina starrii TaxID=330485 RepID=A0A9W6EWS1_9CHLO|nr:hypothetical protein PLESTM_000077300 [Pleodorina starrii]GLC48298.1 hypothetical protein PLESTB_000080900 [Pleodorina starrii]GLC66583.1 hypothetical protein PLESTF_000446700 [Pleodorina starrii]
MALAQKTVISTPAKSHSALVAPAVRAQPVARRVRSARAQASNALTVAQTKAIAQTNGSPVAVPAPMEEVDLAKHMQDRHAHVLRYFPTALGVDDFMARVEIALAGFGFTGDNTIAMTNLCRDEVTQVVKDKIEACFGSSFNTNGLGAVLTCGVTGMKAGLSHSPVCAGGRERYVFFAFPHIAINSEGEMGAISRPGRPKKSCACGALQKCLIELKAEGVEAAVRSPGLHDPLEPEYSILKQRLARRIRYEKTDVSVLDLPSLTQIAERTISDDLEYLIEKAVNPAMADYAVITGTEIHNWAADLEDGGEPSMEFVAPTKAYVVVNGVKTHLDLMMVPPMSFRQLQLMAARSLMEVPPGDIAAGLRGSVLQEIPYAYLEKRMGGAATEGAVGRAANPVNLQIAAEWPSWQSRIRRDNNAAPYTLHQLERDMYAPTMDSPELANLN